jgi:predicted metal-dependent peptidase
MSPEELVTKAVTHIMFSNPFFASLVPRVGIYPKKDIPTAQTNGKVIYYNPDFVKNLNVYEIAGVIIHEVLHCAMLHCSPSRHGGRDRNLWGQATDYAINDIILDIPQVQLPDGALIDDRFSDVTAEEVYAILKDEQPQGGTPSPEGTFCGELGEPEEGTSAADDVFNEQEWKAAVAHAAQESKKAGNMPGKLEQLFKAILEPKLPWEDVLYNFMDVPGLGKKTWTRPNKRYLSMGIHLPTPVPKFTGDFVCAIDVSGSMSNDMVSMVINQVAYITSIIKPNSVTLMQHDTNVKKPVAVYETEDEFPEDVPILGRGGTDFIPVFEYIDQEFDDPPSAVIMLTDGEGPCPQDQPDYPVLWIIVDNDDLTMPWGEHAWINTN